MLNVRTGAGYVRMHTLPAAMAGMPLCGGEGREAVASRELRAFDAGGR